MCRCITVFPHLCVDQSFPLHLNEGGQIMKATYKNIDDLPIMLNASDIVNVLGISRAFAYNLLHDKNPSGYCDRKAAGCE